jgi:ATP-dependent protease HslVU (ClpYQ) peptidase subunit
MVNVRKVRAVGKGFVGAAGDWGDVLHFWDLIEKTGNYKDGQLHDNSELEAIELQPDCIYLYGPSGARYAITDEFYAIGSGGPYAMGAMAMGATPEEAVAIASRFDPGTGGDVETFVLKAARNGSNSRKR